MANGRMITKDICGDKRINQLSTDTSRLAFTWLVTFCDREGRTHGDPAMVRSLLFPRRQDVSIEQMEQMILEWFTLGLVVWYEADGDLWIWFPGFDKNQPGLRKDKEAPSKIPEPTDEGTDKVRTRYGVKADKLPLKGIEVKGKEGNVTPPPFVPDLPPDDPIDPSDPYEILRVTAQSKGVIPSSEGDDKAIRELLKVGVTPADLEAGIEWKAKHNEGKPVKWFSQVVEPAKVAMRIRLQNTKPQVTAAGLGYTNAARAQ